jgi:hypothetical protein
MAKKTCPPAQHLMPNGRCMKDAEMRKRKQPKPNPGPGRRRPEPMY